MHSSQELKLSSEESLCLQKTSISAEKQALQITRKRTKVTFMMITSLIA